MSNTQITMGLAIRPEAKPQDYNKDLYACYELLFKYEEWKMPPFQREPCWSTDQKLGWMQAVIDGTGIGVIVTYQTSGGGITFLADGRQRLEATRQFIDSPTEFGFSFDTDQAIVYCRLFSMTHQHRIYKDHHEAMLAFQRLNRGTALTRLEFYKGNLALSTVGKMIIDEIPEIVKRYEIPLLSSSRTKIPRARGHANIRDAYGLFLQYISKTSQLTLWDLSRSMPSTPQGMKIVEEELSLYIKDHEITESTMEKLIRDFDKFISEQCAEISTVMSDIGATGRGISPTAMRWILHLATWRKNTERPVSMYVDFLKSLFTYCIREYGRVGSRIEVPSPDGETTKTVVTMNMNGLNHLLTLCRAFNSQLYEGQKTRKKAHTAPGYHRSHIKPFSSNGDGETIPESGLRNRARGAKPIVELST